MKLIVFLIVAFLGVSLVLVLEMPHKDVVRNLVMPGPVSRPHAEVEQQCNKCHSEFKKERQSTLCLQCHEPVAKDIAAKANFHGHIEGIAAKECAVCHSEHRGRAYDMVRLDRETFKHEQTGFELKGAHARLSIACVDCHQAGKKFREAVQDCFGCHRDDDHHRGQLGAKCADCHRETAWRDTFFDHNTTHFPLTGKHKDVTCVGCHAEKTYKNTPRDCVSCHLVNDVHDSPNKERCDRCHTADRWKAAAFDHNRETKFPLKGGHATTACAACHKDNVFKVSPGKGCADCHQVDDAHKGKNGTDCARCHSETAWKPVRFDHNRDTKFKLSGKHAGAACDACHVERSQDMTLDSTCYACHMADDVHKGQEGKDCRACHNDGGWLAGVKFDHDLTGFPLIGQHAVASCTECHQSHAYKDAPVRCAGCHEKDDVHQKTLGSACGQCHNPNGWKLWQFDHNAQTKYKLEGAHAGLKCAACHKRPMDGAAPNAGKCYDCHEKDDVHKGQFGQNCEQCHGVDKFKNWVIRK